MTEVIDIQQPVAGPGLRPGEQIMLNKIEANEVENRVHLRDSRRRELRHYVSYSDRLRIRELEMQKRELQKELTGGAVSRGKGYAIANQMRGIDRQIEQIRAPKW